jgi:hypothetical protein
MKLIEAFRKGDERLDGTCVGALVIQEDGKVLGCAMGAIIVGMMDEMLWSKVRRAILREDIGVSAVFMVLSMRLPDMDVPFVNDMNGGDRQLVENYLKENDLADVEL